MAEPPRGKRFQIHLSTAVVMMFAAGGMVGLNVWPRQRLMFVDNWDSWGFFETEHGWPFTFAGWSTDWKMVAADVCLSLLFVWVILLWSERWLYGQYRFASGALNRQWIPTALAAAVIGTALAFNFEVEFYNMSESGSTWWSQGWPVVFRYTNTSSRTSDVANTWFIGSLLADILACILITAAAIELYRYVIYPWLRNIHLNPQMSPWGQAALVLVAVVLIPLSYTWERKTVFLGDELGLDKESSQVYTFEQVRMGWPVTVKTRGTYEIRSRHLLTSLSEIKAITPETDWIFNVNKTKAQEIIRMVVPKPTSLAFVVNAIFALLTAIAAGCAVQFCLMALRIAPP